MPLLFHKRDTTRPGLALALAVGLWLMLAGSGVAWAAPLDPPSLLAQQSGTYVYDQAGRLSSGDKTDLQTRASQLAKAGANPVVYVQGYGVMATETQREAAQLASNWHLGDNAIVFFLNLDPDPAGKTNSFFLFTGPRYDKPNQLDGAAKQQIYNTQIAPQFKNQQYAAGLAAGLDAAQSRIATASRSPASSGFDPRGFLSFMLVVGLVIWGVIMVRRARQPLAAGYGRARPGEMPQDGLAPALVGSLVRGQAQDRDVRAAILEMSAAGVIAIEPLDDRTIQLRLVDKSLLTETWQLMIWESLASVADAQQVITATGLGKAAATWQPIYAVIDSELRQRGLRRLAGEAAPADRRQHLGTVVAEAGGALALVSLFMIAIPGLKEAWFLFTVIGLGAVIWGLGIRFREQFVQQQAQQLPPDLTPTGIPACAAWRDYGDHLRARTIRRVDPTRLTLFAPVLDAQQEILPWLITSARMGFVPTWLSQGMTTARSGGVTLSPFYVYWLALFQGYVDPAIIQPLPENPQQLSREEFMEPVGGIIPASYNTLPFMYPIGMPLYMPIFLPEPVYIQGGDGGWSGGGGDFGGGGGDFGGGGGDFGGGGGDFGGGGGGGDF